LGALKVCWRRSPRTQRSLNPDLERLRGVVSEMVLSVARNPDALLWLARLRRTDQYSYDHSLDVSAHVMIFGRYLGLGDEAVATLGMAGMLQDVGKLRLPVRLLHKKGALSPREYEILRRTWIFRCRFWRLRPTPRRRCSTSSVVTTSAATAAATPTG
jgi:response regulator RpfG family c-di-GMP phosphodiesterase